MTTLTSNPSPKKEQSAGLICPSCSGVVPVAEGLRIVECPYCHQYSLVQGDRGVRRWQVTRRVERPQAEEAVKAFFSGLRKARDLKRTATISEIILVYLPFWRVEATVAGWLFGRVRKDKDETKPDEHNIFQSMHWNDAAVDVTEFGVHRVVVSRDDLQPFDNQGLHAEAMVFEPTESRTEALAEAEEHFRYRSRQDAGQSSTSYENIQLLRPEFGLVYYPVWLCRYTYRNRTYQVVIDGVYGRTMYGKAPGETLYRAAALVAGLATGCMILVNGTILAGLFASGDDDGFSIILLPIAIGIALILTGYRQFRYGEEVEDKPKDYQKLATSRNAGLLGEIFSLEGLPGMMRSGMTMLEDLQELGGKGRLPGKP
jgi:hypothetical protein